MAMFAAVACGIANNRQHPRSRNIKILKESLVRVMRNISAFERRGRNGNNY